MIESFRALKSIRKVLWLFLFLSIIIVILLLASSDAKITSLKDILLKISLSYISAFIFYFLVVVIKEFNDKNIVNKTVDIFIVNIINDTFALTKSFSVASKKENDKIFPSKSEIDSMLKEINGDSNATYFLFEAEMAIGYEYPNWIELFKYYKARIDNNINSIFSVLKMNDVVLINHLVKIKNNNFLVSVEHTKYPAIRLPENIVANLDVYADHIKDLLDAIRSLALYRNIILD